MAGGALSNGLWASLARSRTRARRPLHPPEEDAARHGAAARPTPPAQDAEQEERSARFGRLFPYLPAGNPGDKAIDALVKAMAELTANGIDGDPNPRVPAGYTYLGQFIDHDVTFDTTSRLGRVNEPSALVNVRTPRLDLDSVYGAGPAQQPYLYDWHCDYPGAKLLVTINAPGTLTPGGDELACRDLPRNAQGRALIGDPRNDENLIISQLQLLFVRFHNAVVDRLGARGKLAGAALFMEARRIVRWHYQWIVMHDFLPKLVGVPMAAKITPRPLSAAAALPPHTTRLYPFHQTPIIPVEFSAAAYRVGHTMVRPTYDVNDGQSAVKILPAPGDPDDTHHLGGFRPLLADLEIEWDHFFFDGVPSPRHNHSMKMDEYLVAALFDLPIRFTSGQVPAASGPTGSTATKKTELARLNLQRGQALGLPSGADVARALGKPPLSPTQLFPGPSYNQQKRGSVPGLELDAASKDAIFKATPLWYYILREAASYNENGLPGTGRDARHGVATNGCQLGPVGGRIVAEVLVGLLESDTHSYVNQHPEWTPDESSDVLLPFISAKAGDFTMLDLVRFTTAGDA